MKKNKLTYNIAQLMLLLAAESKDEVYAEYGRATGKTTAIGGLIKKMIKELPRASIGLLGESYQQLLTRILPSVVNGLEMHGIYQDIHYFIGRSAPRSWHWPKAYADQKDKSRAITFYNGMCINMISQDKQGDGRGLNLDGLIVDEAALINKEKLDESVRPAVRGSNKDAFNRSGIWGCKVFVSSTPIAPEGLWFTDMEDVAKTQPDKMAFLKADYRVNAHNLMPGFIESAKATTIPYIFNAEYLNIRPNRTKNSFYALLQEERHTYTNYDYTHYVNIKSSQDSRGDADCYKTLPLIIGLDFGAVINCAATAQELKSLNALNVIKHHYTLGDNQQNQDDLADDWIKYYQYHSEKVVEMWYDNSGNNQTGNTRLTKAEQFAAKLRAAGWKVKMMTQGGANALHDLKHRLYELLLAGDHPSLPIFKINKPNCRELWISMTNAKAIVSKSGATIKDKSVERSKRIPRQFATDPSDALDSIIVGKYIHYVSTSGRTLPR